MTRVLLAYRPSAALPDDRRRYALHDREVSLTLAPGPQHQDAVGSLYAALRAHVAARGLGQVYVGPVDVILSDATVVQPDIVYLDPPRLDLISGRGIEGPPTLVVEIVSPATARADRETKRDLYARHGVPYFWIVDPERRRHEMYRLAAGAYGLVARAAGDAPVAGEPFPGLRLPTLPGPRRLRA